MLLFTRTLTLHGNQRDTIPWAIDMTSFVNDHSEVPVSLWNVAFGQPVGTVSWSALIDSRAVLEATTQSLMADKAYFDRIEHAREWVQEPAHDDLREVVHNSGPEYRRAEIGSAVYMVTAELKPGKYRKGGAFGIEILDLYSSLTGAPALFLRDLYGQFGQVTWLANFASMAEVDAATETVNKDMEYLEKMDEGGDLFIAGSGRQGLAQRLA